MPEITLIEPSWNHNDNVMNQIRENYDETTVKDIRDLMSTKNKIVRHTRRRTFLLTCRTEDMIPDFITNLMKNLIQLKFDSGRTSRKFDTWLIISQRKVLNLQIDDVNTNLRHLKKKLDNLLCKISSVLSQEDFDLLMNYQDCRTKHLNDKIYKTHVNKINGMRRKKFNIEEQPPTLTNNSTPDTSKKWLVNLSNIEIPAHVANIVSLGPKFNLESEKISFDDKAKIIKNVENSINNVPDAVQRDEIRNIIVEEIIKDKHRKQKHLPQQQKLIRNHLESTKKFIKDNDIMFTSADKGNVTVAVKKSEYYTKVKSMLANTDVYEKLDANPLKDIAENLQKLCTDWKKGKYINYSTWEHLHETDGNLPKCYALPKIHKKDVPFRPIISYVDSPLYNLSKYITRLITSSLPPSKFNVKNSLEFKDRLKNIKLNDDQTMISLDVTSLFTNVSCDAILNSLEKRWSLISKNTKLPWWDFEKAVKLILDSTFFTFDNDFYKQKFGTPMGSCASPIFCDIVVQDLEINCFDKVDFDIPIYVRYVDDSFMVVPKSKVDYIVNLFNSQDSHLKFTYELESDKKLAFLDTEVIRHENKIITNWYQKETFFR